ncbi:MAG: 50S ribosomal protein L25, partial [Muribaculaceae bacterium]|nr:50S ribosomal protein L25 [Muribaculaceae bacterium]
MKTFQLTAEPRTDLGKKATKALRNEGKIPAVINGGAIVTLPYSGTLKPGEKLVEIEDGKGLIT